MIRLSPFILEQFKVNIYYFKNNNLGKIFLKANKEQIVFNSSTAF